MAAEYETTNWFHTLCEIMLVQVLTRITTPGFSTDLLVVSDHIIISHQGYLIEACTQVVEAVEIEVADAGRNLQDEGVYGTQIQMSSVWNNQRLMPVEDYR